MDDHSLRWSMSSHIQAPWNLLSHPHTRHRTRLKHERTKNSYNCQKTILLNWVSVKKGHFRSNCIQVKSTEAHFGKNILQLCITQSGYCSQPNTPGVWGHWTSHHSFFTWNTVTSSCMSARSGMVIIFFFMSSRFHWTLSLVAFLIYGFMNKVYQLQKAPANLHNLAPLLLKVSEVRDPQTSFFACLTFPFSMPVSLCKLSVVLNHSVLNQVLFIESLCFQSFSQFYTFWSRCCFWFYPQETSHIHLETGQDGEGLWSKEKGKVCLFKFWNEGFFGGFTPSKNVRSRRSVLCGAKGHWQGCFRFSHNAVCVAYRNSGIRFCATRCVFTSFVKMLFYCNRRRHKCRLSVGFFFEGLSEYFSLMYFILHHWYRQTRESKVSCSKTLHFWKEIKHFFFFCKSAQAFLQGLIFPAVGLREEAKYTAVKKLVPNHQWKRLPKTIIQITHCNTTLPCRIHWHKLGHAANTSGLEMCEVITNSLDSISDQRQSHVRLELRPKKIQWSLLNCNLFCWVIPSNLHRTMCFASLFVLCGGRKPLRILFELCRNHCTVPNLVYTSESTTRGKSLKARSLSLKVFMTSGHWDQVAPNVLLGWVVWAQDFSDQRPGDRVCHHAVKR